MRAAVIPSLLVALTVGLTGCSVPVPALSDEEFVGTWVHAEPDGTTELNLGSDGTFTLDSVPRRVVSGVTDTDDVSWSDTVDLSGTWAGHFQDGSTVSLEFEEGSDTRLDSLTVHTSSDNGHVVLYTWVDPDADVRFVFEAVEP